MFVVFCCFETTIIKRMQKHSGEANSCAFCFVLLRFISRKLDKLTTYVVAVVIVVAVVALVVVVAAVVVVFVCCFCSW